MFVPDLPALIAMAPMMIMAAKRAARKGAKKARHRFASARTVFIQRVNICIARGHSRSVQRTTQVVKKAIRKTVTKAKKITKDSKGKRVRLSIFGVAVLGELLGEARGNRFSLR